MLLFVAADSKGLHNRWWCHIYGQNKSFGFAFPGKGKSRAKSKSCVFQSPHNKIVKSGLSAVVDFYTSEFIHDVQGLWGEDGKILNLCSNCCSTRGGMHASTNQREEAMPKK